MIKEIIGLFFIFTLETRASANFEPLLKAKNLQDVRSWAQTSRKLQVLEKTCELELASVFIPLHCFQLYKFSKDRGAINKLNSLCKERVQNHKEIINLIPGLSLECQQEIRQKNKELDYMFREKNLQSYLDITNRP